MSKPSNNIRGVGFLLLALFTISLQTIAAKWLSGAYPVLEIVILRSLVALPFILLLYRYEGKRGLPTTQQHKLEYLRDEHQHRRLGFADDEMRRWLSGAGLTPSAPIALPPDTDGLTVSIWTAERPAVAAEKVA